MASRAALLGFGIAMTLLWMEEHRVNLILQRELEYYTTQNHGLDEV